MKKGGEQKQKKKMRRKQNNKETQWCSGITCVLAKLRAHYPEHQQQKKKGEGEEEEESKPTHHTPFHPTQTITAIPQ